MTFLYVLSISAYFDFESPVFQHGNIAERHFKAPTGNSRKDLENNIQCLIVAEEEHHLTFHFC